MYWNCTTPQAASGLLKQYKLDFIATVVQAIAPDVLCLDEVSTNVNSKSAAKEYARNHLNGAGVAYDRPVVSPNPGSHLNGVAWVKDGIPAKQTTVGIPAKDWDSSGTKRDMVYVKVTIGMQDAYLWFLHANASTKGGKTAVGLVEDIVDDSRDVYVGDYNCPIQNAGGAVAPAVNGHNFTQWKRDDFGHATVPNHLPPMKYTPHGIIDYAIADPSEITLAAVDAVAGHNLREFIGQFDHFPVAYDLT
jgi:endonuclease/exonuclease/phosphatase family metal-dependent hydrolase